jgi:pimeloyl-ACP methyl ester carboxylesterase
VTRPLLVIMGSEDPDFADPRAEGEAIVAAVPAGVGRVAVVDGGGHYPHAQYGDRVAELISAFLQEHAADPVRDVG